MTTYEEFVEWLKDHNYPRNVLLSRHDYAIVKARLCQQPLTMDDGGEYIVWEDIKIRPYPPIAQSRPDLVDVSDANIFRGWGEGE